VLCRLSSPGDAGRSRVARSPPVSRPVRSGGNHETYQARHPGASPDPDNASRLGRRRPATSHEPQTIVPPSMLNRYSRPSPTAALDRAGVVRVPSGPAADRLRRTGDAAVGAGRRAHCDLSARREPGSSRQDRTLPDNAATPALVRMSRPARAHTTKWVRRCRSDLRCEGDDAVRVAGLVDSLSFVVEVERPVVVEVAVGAHRA
jgi:hypothetical protein